MERINVESSNLESIWYDPDQMILEVEFKSWLIYQYYDVPQEEYNSLMESDSQGKYLAANIKNIYSYDQIS